MSRYIDYDAIDYRNDRLHDKSEEFLNGVIYMAQRIEDAPSIDIEPKRGEWINLHNGKWKCSECGIEVLIYAKGNFCPNCGADMREREGE